MLIILRQLANEGVFYREKFGMHWLDVSRNAVAANLGSESTFEEAVDDAIKGCIAILPLLSKLQDAIKAESDGTLADILVTAEDQEEVYHAYP